MAHTLRDRSPKRVSFRFISDTHKVQHAHKLTGHIVSQYHVLVGSTITDSPRASRWRGSLPESHDQCTSTHLNAEYLDVAAPRLPESQFLCRLLVRQMGCIEAIHTLRNRFDRVWIQAESKTIKHTMSLGLALQREQADPVKLV